MEGARGTDGGREGGGKERDGADLFDPKQGSWCSQRIRFVGRQGDNPSLANMIAPAKTYSTWNPFNFNTKLVCYNSTSHLPVSIIIELRYFSRDSMFMEAL